MTKEHLISLMSSLSSDICPLSSHLELDHFIEAILVRQKVVGLDFNEDFVKRAWEHWRRERGVGKRESE
jgi:hypothetical protein